MVHKFIATCGTSLPGKAHKAVPLDEEGAGGHEEEHEIERKCPKVLNIASEAQPAIDRHNRYRQYILAMEKRLLTNRFNMRFATTMWGMVFTNAFFAFKYFHNNQADFRGEMNKLAIALMRNPEFTPDPNAGDEDEQQEQEVPDYFDRTSLPPCFPLVTSL